MTARATYLKAAYGLTVAQWNQMFKLQNGLCPICLKQIHKPGHDKRAAAVDHDHVTKRVRGLLCYRCNRFIVGRLRGTEQLKRVIVYLESDFDGRKL